MFGRPAIFLAIGPTSFDMFCNFNMMSDQKTSLRQLPYDVLLNILSYLDIHELHSLEVLPELKPLF